jgi:hypothetical protein
MTILMTALVVVNLQLVVRIYDSVGVSPAELDRARASAGAILASVGIEPIWRPCHVSTCTGPVTPHEIAIRIVRSSPQSEKNSLGFSVIDVPSHSGSLGTVYEDRVGDLAAQAGVDDGELLGRAMAHEIGHMLIGTPSHARFGLMRAVWASGELRRGRPLDWMFSPKEGSELRRRLTARTTAPTVPESLVASALWLE